jgi:SpoIIAA-like
MTVEIKELSAGKVLEVKISGKLHKEDYEHFVPAVEKEIAAQGKVRLLVEMHAFHGWDVSALWQDIKFDLKHFKDIERLALVGESKWEKGMANFCKPFTTAKIQYFDIADAATARTWIAEGLS